MAEMMKTDFPSVGEDVGELRNGTVTVKKFNIHLSEDPAILLPHIYQRKTTAHITIQRLVYECPQKLYSP